LCNEGNVEDGQGRWLRIDVPSQRHHQ
jgi:hypothetical protein